MTGHQGTLRVLAGSGRSGTTWLQDVLCEANGLRAIFEPLEPHGWHASKPFSRKYANAQTDWPELEAYWRAASCGRAPSTWSDYRVRPDRLIPKVSSFKSLTAFKQFAAHWLALRNNRKKYGPQTLHAESLVKAIRANLMVSWLAHQPNSKIGFVLRHPASVVESQLRLGNDWNAKAIASLYEGDHRLDERLGLPWSTLCDQAKNDAELFTLIWCLENALPLQDCKTSENVTFLCFEHLANGDSSAWKKLLKAFDLKTMPSAELVNRPSQQASKNMDQAQSQSQYLAGSLGRLSDNDRGSVQRVLDRCGVEFYTTSTMEPQLSLIESVYLKDWSKP